MKIIGLDHIVITVQNIKKTAVNLLLSLYTFAVSEFISIL